MNSINPTKFVEDLVHSYIPLEKQNEYQFKFVSYTRWKKNSDLEDDRQIEYPKNKHIFETINANEKDWDCLVYIHKFMTDNDEAGYMNVLYYQENNDHHKNLFIPTIDFAPGVDIEKCDFGLFSDCQNNLVIFDSGNSYHGVLDRLLNKAEYVEWLKILSMTDFVDQKWLDIATNNVYGSHGQILRTTGSTERPEPRYLKHISLFKENNNG